MNRTFRHLTMLVASGALLLAPAAGLAHHEPGHAKGAKDRQSKSKRCKKPATKVGFVVRGTLTSYTADDSASPADEASLTIAVTGANRHARKSGELADTDAGRPGTQVQGGAYGIAGADDAFKLRLVDYEAGEEPAAGDRVKIIGKVARTRAKCAARGTSLADRYGDVNVRKAVLHDAD